MYAFVVYALLGATVLHGLRLGDAPALAGERQAWLAAFVLVLLTRLLEPVLNAGGAACWMPFVLLMVPFCRHDELLGLHNYVLRPLYTGQHTLCDLWRALAPALRARLSAWPTFARAAEAVAAAGAVCGRVLDATGARARADQAAYALVYACRALAERASTPLGSPNEKKLE